METKKTHYSSQMEAITDVIGGGDECTQEAYRNNNQFDETIMSQEETPRPIRTSARTNARRMLMTFIVVGCASSNVQGEGDAWFTG